MSTDSLPSPSAEHAGSSKAAKRRFLHDAAEHVRDTGHRAFVRKALGGYYPSRDTQKSRYRDWEQARDAASRNRLFTGVWARADGSPRPPPQR